jgi:lipid II isoglutaminyl synthase (glutamine-hydrolysing)
VAARVGTTIGGISRRLHLGGGSVIGGRAILAVDRNALERLAAGRRVALVSGTNGKTTTTSLLRAALATQGPVITNVQGANLPPGLAAALADGRPGVPAALEVDEAWLGAVMDQVHPAVVTLLNLSRDQLDRNNEVRRLANRWRQALASRPGLTVVANADDPLVVWGAGSAADVRWVGAGQPWTDDAAGCPSCGARIEFGGEAGWACPDCGLKRPELAVRLGDADVSLQLPGRANRANAVLALTAAEAMGVDRDAAAAALGEVSEVVGRYATVVASGKEARLLLAKNPAGWLEVFDFLRPAPVPVVVAINARVADGKDPSWLWDVPFERLRGRFVVATGERSRDLAVRLHYAEVEHLREEDLIKAIGAAPADSVDVVANYTSFQQLRTRLT